MGLSGGYDSQGSNSRPLPSLHLVGSPASSAPPSRGLGTVWHPTCSHSGSDIPRSQNSQVHPCLHQTFFCPPKCLPSILNCSRPQILPPAQSSKYTQNPATSFSHAPSPGLTPASLTWTRAVPSALDPGSHSHPHSLSSPQPPPEGACEPPTQVASLLCPQPTRVPTSLG